MKLKAKPVKVYKTPSYPNMEKAVINPDLLKKLPERWRYNKSVIAAIIALSSLSFTGCNTQSPEATSIDKKASISIENSEEAAKTDATPKTYMVAPIFEHGKGTGAIGCDVVAPPAFMSEQEAMAIIKNEALKAGIHLDDVPEKYSVEPHSNLGKAVGLEAADKEKRIAVSFISHEESRENDVLISTPSGPVVATSSSTTYRMLERAKDAVNDWEKMDIPYIIGTFYDPEVEFDKAMEILGSTRDSSMSYVAEAKKVSEEDLRAQVRDFIEWLRGQGVILLFGECLHENRS